MAKSLSDEAGEWAEKIRDALPKGAGITVILSTDEGRVGVASNVQPDALVSAVVGWHEQLKARGGLVPN